MLKRIAFVLVLVFASCFFAVPRLGALASATVSCDKLELPFGGGNDPNTEAHCLLSGFAPRETIQASGLKQFTPFSVGPDGSAMAVFYSLDGDVPGPLTVVLTGETSGDSVTLHFVILPPGRYVALGDSYSSGEGGTHFAQGTDTSSDSCHRSTNAYPHAVRGPAPVEFWACSGAIIRDFYQNNHQSSGEIRQLAHLSGGPVGLVTLGIGGNDIGFSYIIQQCIKANVTIFVAQKNLSGDCRSRISSEIQQRINGLLTGQTYGDTNIYPDPVLHNDKTVYSLPKLFADVRAAAPKATILALGYPTILPSNPTDDCQAQAARTDGSKATFGFLIGIETRFSQSDVQWLNQVFVQLNQQIATAALEAGIDYIDNSSTFGSFDICHNVDNENTDPGYYAHGLVLDGSDNPSALSFHPTDAGQGRIGNTVNAALSAFQDPIQNPTFFISPSQTINSNYLVGVGQTLLSILTTFHGSDVVASLTSPSGRVITRTTTAADVEHVKGATYEIYAIRDPEPGTWKVQLFGADVPTNGESVKLTMQQVGTAGMHPNPVIIASHLRGATPLHVAFDGSRSTALNGAHIVSYSWDFGDGSAPASGATVSHTFNAGVYGATLTVTDNHGLSRSAQQQIRVTTTNDPPVAAFDEHHNATAAPLQVIFDGSRANDPDGLITSYRYDFGDGTAVDSPVPIVEHFYRTAGTYVPRLTITDDRALTSVTAGPAITVSGTTHAPAGYWMLGADGTVYPFGSAGHFGSSPGFAVAIAPRRDGRGYWTVDPNGDVSHFGAAADHGGRPGLQPGEIVSTISSTPSGNGYWLFTNRGRAFAYGDAHLYGDMSHVALNGPVIASVATPTGHGYYMVASDGGVFAFGDAHFHGSTGNIRLNRPVVGLSPTPDNQGYWLVASDGGVFAFNARFRGSMGATPLNKPVNGLVAYGDGYLMVASDGGVFDFSDTAFVGSLGNSPPSAPIVGIAAA